MVMGWEVDVAVLTAAALGTLGGLVRALYGLLKATGQGLSVNKGYFFLTLVASAFIGGILGVVFGADYKVAALSGYVGTDLLENIFKGSIGRTLVSRKK